MLISLVNNISLLLALSICHSFIVQRFPPSSIHYKLISGALFGLVIIAGMMNPFVLTEGIIFDGRSLVASVAGLFGGPITASIVALLGCGYRWFWIGGDGALMGVLVIITSVSIGVIYHNLIKRQVIHFSYRNLYILGIITHIMMILWMMLLPADFAWLTIKTITIPVMVLFPVGTVLLGKLLNDQIQFRDIYQKLNESEERHRSIFENNHAVMLLLDPDNHTIIDANPAACQFYGYTRNELQSMHLCNINTLPLDELKVEMNKARTKVKGFFNFKHRLANGDVRNVEVFSGPINWTTKEVFLSFIFDVTEKHTAKKLLKESEARYKSFVENSPNGIFIQAEFNFIYVNRAFVKLMGGQSPDDLLYRSIFDHFHKDYHEIIKQRLQIMYQSKETANPIEEIMIDLNGAEVFVEISAVPIMVNNKDAAFVFVRDIREQKRSEQLLKESEERFRVALTELPFPVLIHNEHGKMIYINRAWTDLSGYSLNDIPTVKDWIKKAHRNSYQDINKIVKTLYQIEHRVDEGEFIITTKSGQTRIWNFSSSPLGQDRDGSRLVISVANDLTESKEQEEIFKSIVDNIPVMIGYFNADGQYHWVNRAWETTLGVSLEEMQQSSDHYMSVFYPDENYRKEVIEFIQKADGVWGNFETSTGDGSVIQTLWSNIRMSDNSIIGFGLDITKEKELERQLLQSQKMESVGHLAGGVAHDFNNILTAIIGYNNFAINKVKKEDAIYHDLHQVAISAERAANLTRQLLAFSRKQILKTEIVDLNNLVLNMDKMLHRLIGEDIEYVTIPADQLWKVEVDPGQIEQVITNLVVNARDAMPTGGKITIETKNVIFDEEYTDNHAEVNPGSFVMLAVSDTGIGIPKSDLTKIFDPFFTTKEKGKGTGLGLAMVHGIIKQSGGNINLYSEVGQGTTFKLYFPKAAMVTESETDKPITSNLYQGNETILIVEDDDLLRKLLIQSLENAGYNVISAAYGSEAIAVYNKHDGKIDLLVTDVIMPKMSGKELAHYLLKNHPELKVLYISGYTDNAIVHHGILDEGVNFLQKPFSPQSLLKEIRRILEG